VCPHPNHLLAAAALPPEHFFVLPSFITRLLLPFFLLSFSFPL